MIRLIFNSLALACLFWTTIIVLILVSAVSVLLGQETILRFLRSYCANSSGFCLTLLTLNLAFILIGLTYPIPFLILDVAAVITVPVIDQMAGTSLYGSLRRPINRLFNGFGTYLEMFAVAVYAQLLEELMYRRSVRHIMEAERVRMSSIMKIKYGKLSAGQRKSDQCAICLSDFENGDDVRLISKCKHCYHDDCIQRWIKQSLRCPLCRGDML